MRMKFKQISRPLIIGLCLVAFGGVAKAADTIKGQEIFMMHCFNCHEPGRAIPGAQDFSRGEGMMQSDLSLFDKIKRGKAAMPAYDGILEDQMILDVIAYMRTLQ